MKSFKFKDLMVNVASAGQKEALFCGFGATACGHNSLCYLTCPGVSHCYIHTIPRVQAGVEEAARVGQIQAAYRGFGPPGTYCGFSIEPCGYTCDFGNTHLTRRFAVEEQARVAAPAAQAGAVPAAVVCAVTASPCGHITCGFTCGFHTCFGCTIWPTNICRIGPTFVACQAATCAATCGFTPDPGTPVYQGDPEGIAGQLAAVKAQLQQELAAVETQEKAVAEALKPQTAAEVEELQGKLRDAIAELDKQKQELQKAEKTSKK